MAVALTQPLTEISTRNFLGVQVGQRVKPQISSPSQKHYGPPRPVSEIYLPSCLLRMVSSGMLRRVALVRTDVSEEPSASFISVTRIAELGTTLAVTSNRRTSLQRASVASYS
jgi:hypothetical protein